MQQNALPVHEIYPHVRVVMGMVIGLGVTRLLSGLARIVQHPARHRLYGAHLAWVASVLLALVHFWWWQFGLYQIEAWTFGIYLFVVGYAIVLFLMCALLFPESMQGYANYKDYFHARRAWFFGLLAATYLLDVVDTFIKGEAHFARFAHEYLIRTPLLVLLCVAAMKSASQRFQVFFVAVTLVYQVSWIFRLFDTLG
jgi:hypothetical protein